MKEEFKNLVESAKDIIEGDLQINEAAVEANTEIFDFLESENLDFDFSTIDAIEAREINDAAVLLIKSIERLPKRIVRGLVKDNQLGDGDLSLFLFKSSSEVEDAAEDLEETLFEIAGANEQMSGVVKSFIADIFNKIYGTVSEGRFSRESHFERQNRENDEAERDARQRRSDERNIGLEDEDRAEAERVRKFNARIRSFRRKF